MNGRRVHSREVRENLSGPESLQQLRLPCSHPRPLVVNKVRVKVVTIGDHNVLVDVSNLEGLDS